jgi:hypothetical protein
VALQARKAGLFLKVRLWDARYFNG